MIPVGTTKTIQGLAGTGSVIIASAFGLDKATGFYDLLGSATLGTGATTIATAGAASYLANVVTLSNSSGSSVAGIKIFAAGVAVTGLFAIPPNGSAVVDGTWLNVYDNTGALISTALITLVGDVTGSGASPITATIANNAVSDAKFRQGSARTVVGVTGNATANVADIQGATDQVLRVNGAGTALGFGAIDLSKAAAAGGVIQAASFPALTGDVTTVAGALASTIAASAVTNAKMANMTQRTIKGRAVGAGTGAPTDLTATEATAVIEDASFTLPGRVTAEEKLEINSMDGRTNAGASKRVFRPGDYMIGNTFDPTGTANSTTAFQAMMTAIATFNDRCTIQLSPGVYKIDPDIIKTFGTNNPAVSIIGPGRGLCILLPTAAGNVITLNRGTTGGDAVTIRGFTIYNTSGTPFTSGAGILTNGADGVDISEIAFIDLFRDIQVSGQPFTFTTNGTTAISVVSPSFVAGDVTQTVSGPGITPGTTLSAQAGTSGTLSGAATTSTAEVRYLNNSIKVSMQKIVSFNTNGNGSGVGIYVNNGLAGDTYMGPEIVMSDGGGTTRRRACIEIVESGHYEITQANLTGSQRGLLIDPGASQIVAFGFHTNLLCDSNTVNGMRLDATTATATIKNIKSVNSWYSGTTVINGSAAAAGVLTAGSGAINGLTFTTDRFLNNRTHGFEHAVGTDFRWSDCDMKGNNSANAAGAAVPPSGNSGLSVAAGVSNWSINGGKYGGTDTVPTAGQQEWGILVAAGAGNNIKISPDDLSGNRLGPIAMGATGASVFVNGCPGLAASYVRGTTAGLAVSAATLVVANTLIPKNSVRVGSMFRVTCRGQHAGAGVMTATVRLGATNDAIGAAATGTAVLTANDTGAANAFFYLTFDVVVTALGAGSANYQGGGSGVRAAVGISATSAARAAGQSFLATADTTADRYLTLVIQMATAAATIYNASIEPVNY